MEIGCHCVLIHGCWYACLAPFDMIAQTQVPTINLPVADSAAIIASIRSIRLLPPSSRRGSCTRVAHNVDHRVAIRPARAALGH